MCSNHVHFYHTLDVLQNIPKADRIIVLENLIARVGRDHKTWSKLDKYGIRKYNSNALFLLQMYGLNLYMTDTMFQQKNKYKTTKMHPDSKEWDLVNYVLIRRYDP